jgi:SAM-dependent methyltransferase
LDRREKLLHGLDLKNLVGLEIGPLDRPLVNKADGCVLHIDYLSTDELRKKYANDPNVNVEKIVEVDVICHQTTLAQALGDRPKADYIVASHVMEHVPDPLGWLEDLRAVLQPGGEIRLAVPDRRFTFDYLRAETRLCDVVNAYLQRTRIPLPPSVLDCCYNVAEVDAVQAWSEPLDPQRLKKRNSPDTALVLARDALQNGNYHDVHCWVFTPHSFSKLFEEVATLGLINFSCERLEETARHEIEFFVTLRESTDRDAVLQSWRKTREVHQASTGPMDILMGRVHDLESRVRDLEAQLAATTSSKSWRVTAPLRRLRGLLRNMSLRGSRVVIRTR